ncbi:MAG: efflux RND transporter permease subunit [Thermoplasmatota archaeon]
MGLRETLAGLDRRLDRGLDSLPDISSRTEREKYRASVQESVSRAKRRAGATIRSIDELGERYAGKLRPRRGAGDRIIDYSTSHPLQVFILLTIITALVGSQAVNIPLYMRGDMEIYLPPDHEATKILAEVRADWSTDVIVIYIKARDTDGDGRVENLTSLPVLLEMSRFEGDDLNKNAPDEKDRGIDPDKDDAGKNDRVMYCLSISTIIKELNSTPERIARALQLPAVSGDYAIPPDQATIDAIVNTIPEGQKESLLKDTDSDGIYDRAAILVGVRTGTTPSFIVGKVDELLERYDARTCEMVNTGPMTVIEKIQGRTIYEFIKVMPFTVLYLVAVLFIFHRTIKAPLLALVPVGYALVVTFGLVGALHSYLIISPQIALVAPVMLALGISYGVYIANRFTEERKGTPMERARSAARAMHPAILLSAGTTAIGFGSLMFGTLPPIAVMGLALAVGIILTYFLTMIMVPTLTVLLSYRKRMEWGGWRGFASVPSDHRKKTLVVFIALILLSLALIPSVRFNADYLAMAPSDDPAFVSMNEYSRTMGGGQIGMVVVRGAPGCAKSVQVLDSIEALEGRVARAPYTSCMSVVDIMKMVKTPDKITVVGLGTVSLGVNVSFWDAIHLFIPDRAKEFLINLFYSSLSTEMRGFLVNGDLSRTLIYVFQPMLDVEETRRAVEGVNEAVDEIPLFLSTASHLTGIAAIQLAVNDLLIQGQLVSLAVCIFASWLVLTFVFRSWRLAVFTIIPCCVVVALEPMVLVGVNIPLSVVTVMIGSIAIGTGVDFSIQISQRVRTGGLTIDSVKSAVESCGVSFVEATATMVIGFMAVLISPSALIDLTMGGQPSNWFVMGVPIQSVREFVVMIQILLGLNALAAMLILPAIYTVWLRFREEEKRRIEREGW